MNFPRQTSSSDSPVSSPATSQALSAALAVESGGSSSKANARADSVSGASSGGSAPGQSDSGPSRSASNSQSQSASEKPQSSQSQLSQSLQSQSQSRSSASNSDSASSGSLSVSESTSISTSASTSQSTVSTSGSVSFTTIVTSIDNQLTTITSALPTSPTSLSTDSSAKTAARRTATIVGATAAVVGVILLLLGILFFYKRHKGRKLEFSEAVGRVRRGAHGAGGVGLLDEEGFDDDDNVPMRRYRDHSTSQSISHSANMSSHSLGPPQSPAPSLFRQRASTGSAFREEGVWPPPQGERFVDPLVGVGTGEGLGHIIDDIMGPAPAATAASSSSLYTDPFRDLSHTRNPSDPSLYYERPGASSSMSMASSSGSRPTTPQSLLGLPAGAAPAPKKPSPLASSAPPSASATWLNRSPKKRAQGLSGSQSSNEGH